MEKTPAVAEAPPMIEEVAQQKKKKKPKKIPMKDILQQVEECAKRMKIANEDGSHQRAGYLDISDMNLTDIPKETFRL